MLVKAQVQATIKHEYRKFTQDHVTLSACLDVCCDHFTSAKAKTLIYYHMHSKWDRIISALVTWIKNISRVSEAKRGRYELIQVTCAEIILSHFECIWWYFSHTFHYLTDEISWKYEKKCQSETWMVAPPICARLTFSPRRLRASR